MNTAVQTVFENDENDDDDGEAMEDGVMASEAAVAAHECAMTALDIERLIDAYNLTMLNRAMRGGQDGVKCLENMPPREDLKDAVLLLAGMGMADHTGQESYLPMQYIAVLYEYLVNLPDNDDRYDATLFFFAHDNVGYGAWDPLCSLGSGTFAMLLNHADPLRIARQMASHGLAALAKVSYDAVMALPMVHFAMHVFDDLCALAPPTRGGEGSLPTNLLGRALVVSKKNFTAAAAAFEAIEGNASPAALVDAGYVMGCTMQDFTSKCLLLFRHYIFVLNATEWSRAVASGAMATTADVADVYAKVASPGDRQNFSSVIPVLPQVDSHTPTCRASYCLFAV